MAKRKLINYRLLNADISRGVRVLNDSAYTKWYGVTSNAIDFVLYVARKFEIGKVTKVEFNYVNNSYRVLFYTSNGFTIITHGLSFGYFGEGSRGSAYLLEKLGFNEQQIRKVFNKQSNFRLYKRVA